MVPCLDSLVNPEEYLTFLFPVPVPLGEWKISPSRYWNHRGIAAYINDDKGVVSVY
jgi:hypothetical protein